jgi:glycerophosphoryl diester phosphodiesterase
VDVRASRDGDLFLLHDMTLDRTTSGSGRLSLLSTAEAARLRLADGAPLPRLEDVLDLCRGRAVLCLDVKARDSAGLLGALLRGREEWVEVWSEHVPLVEPLATAGVRSTLISSGLMHDGIGAQIWRAWECGAGGLSFYPADLEPHVAAACRNARMPFLCGTPNDTRTWQTLVEMGARGIITDRPLECMAWLG